MRSSIAKSSSIGILTLGLTLTLTACATTEVKHHDWSSYPEPGREAFTTPELELPSPNDPAEPVNRRVADAVHWGAEYVVSPLASVWRLLVPEPVRTGLSNFGTNVAYPVRLVGAAVKGEGGTMGVETRRFLYNTTVGILGLRDAATDAGIGAPRAEDLGRAMRHHGWDDSAYVMVPGPTVRDTVGGAGDLFLDPLTYVSGASLVNKFNKASDKVDSYVDFTKSTYDPYRLERLVRVLDRELEESDALQFKAAETGATDTLQYVFLGYRDKSFPDERESREVRIPATGKDLPYSYWLQPHRAPVMYVLPGLGGHRLSSTAGALAEMAFRKGYSVVTISNVMNYEFIDRALTSKFPGFPVSDARDIHHAITAIDADLVKNHPGRFDDGRALMGISLGACGTLYIAAQDDDASSDLLEFDGYLAINPPVNLMHGEDVLDSFYNIPLTYIPDGAEDRITKIRALLRHVIDMAGGGDLRPGKPMPITDLQAQFLVGLAFRMTVIDILDQARDLGRTGDVFETSRTPYDRGASYAEMARYSLNEYTLAFLLPEVAARRDDVSNDMSGLARVNELADLRSVQLQLGRKNNVRVVTNRNDWLLRPEDVEFLRDTFGTNLTLHDHGGHLGNLWHPDMQRELMDEIGRVVPVD